ncbi:MAG: Zn-ribbon containing protein [Thermoplasmatota archaeon]
MPHQCLKCGSAFEEGSPQLLKGCPQCGGNRFFYTKIPLDEHEREKIRDQVGKDIHETLTDLLGQQNSDLVDQAGNWVTMKPKDIRKALKKHITDEDHKPLFQTADSKEIDMIVDTSYRMQRIQKALNEYQQSDTPETIDIQPPGKYNIDVKALLENEPIIIQKDGSYTIHLPSVFKMVQTRKEK